MYVCMCACMYVCGLAWYNYDEAFRRDAAARHVVNWSGMHVELYNFHIFASTWVPQPSFIPLSRESVGALFRTTICRDSKLGRCVASCAVFSLSPSLCSLP